MRWWHGALVVIVVAWLPMGPGNPSVGAAQQEAGLGAPVLTLDEALGIALQNNVNVVNAQLGVKKAGETVGAAKTSRLPSFSLDGITTYSFTKQGYTIPQGSLGTFPSTGPIPPADTTLNSIDGPWGSFGVSLTQPILQQWRIGNVITQHRLQERMATESLRGRQQDVTANVKEQYYQLLKLESALEAAVASVTFYRELVRLVSQYVDQDVAQDYELMETQARLARAEHTMRGEENALQTARERFNNLLARDPKTPFRVSPESPPARAGYPSVAEAESIAVAQRPDVRERELRLEQAKNARAMVGNEYIPSLNFIARYSQLFNVEFIPTTDVSIGLTLRWDIWDWGRKNHEMAAKDAEINQALNDIRDAKAQAAIEVDARLRDLEQAEQLVKVTTIEKAAATEKLRVLTNQYKEKAALLKDVLQAESELAEANTQFQDAILSAWTAQAQLDKAMGQS